MIELLHDEIDKTESLLSKAQTIAETTVSETLMHHLRDDAGDDIQSIFRAALTAVAAEVANAQAAVTTEAVHLGADNARKRAKASK